MTHTDIARELQDHHTRIEACERSDGEQKTDIKEIRSWLFWILATSAMGLVVIVVDLILRLATKGHGG